MTDKNINISEFPNLETEKSNPNTKNTKSKLASLVTFLALTSALVIHPANSEEISSNPVATVADGNVDNDARLAQLNDKIKSLEISLAKIESKNDLQENDFDAIDTIQNQLIVLDEERHAIRIARSIEEEKQLDEKLARAIEEGKQLDEKLAKVIEEGKRLDEKLKQQDEVIKALNNIKQALNGQ